MEVLGHSQISITTNTYSHISEGQSREAANRMGDLFQFTATRWLPVWVPMTSK